MEEASGAGGLRGGRRAAVGAFVLVAVPAFLWPGAAAGSGIHVRASVAPQEKTVTPSPSDTLRLRLELPEEVKEGTPVPMTLCVENLTERTLDLHLTGRPVAFDLVVADDEGNVVWRRLKDEVISMVLGLEPLAPGAFLEFEDTWNQRTDLGNPVTAGTYSVRGEVLTETDPLVTPIRTLRIVSESN
jgi:hypothetical protein